MALCACGRFLRALSCFVKAHEFATVVLEGYNDCGCPHCDIVDLLGDIADVTLSLVSGDGIERAAPDVVDRCFAR